MRRMIAVSVLILVTMFAGVANAQQAGLTKMNVGLGFAASGMMPAWIARDEGLNKKYGLDVKLILFRGSAAATQALIGGSVDMVFGTMSAAITVAGRGAKVAVVASSRLINYMLVTHPDIKTAAQLRGKSVGISNFSGGDDFALMRLLPKLGLTPRKDVKFVVLGTPNPYKKAEAVLNGQTSGTLVTLEVLETLKLRGKKMNMLGAIIPHGIKNSSGDIFVTRSYLKKNPENVKNFLRAFIEAIRMMKNDKQLVVRTLNKNTYTKNPKIQDLVYRTTVRKMFQDEPYPLVEAVKTFRDDLAMSSPGLRKLKNMSVDQFIDNGPLDAIKKEGFYNKIPPLKPAG